MNRNQKELTEKLNNLRTTHPIVFAEIKGRINATYELLVQPNEHKKLTKV